MRRVLALVLLASGTLAADGLTYRFRTTVQGVIPRERSGTVWIDGARARIEVVSEAGRTATLRDPSARDGCTNLDLEQKTYYAAPCETAHSVGALTPGFGMAIGAGASSPGATPKRDRLRVEEHDLGAGGEIAGFPTRHILVTISWRESVRIGPDNVRVEMTRTLEVWATDRVVQAAFQFGHADELLVVPEDVRARLADRLSIAGFPLRFVVASKRKFDRGEPTTETLTTELEDVRTATPNPSLFEVPKGFRHEEPRIGIPSR